MHYESPIREPLILEDKTLHDITEDVARPIEEKANKWWWHCFCFHFQLFFGRRLLAYTAGTGIGVWGLNKTIGWAGISLTLYGG